MQENRPIEQNFDAFISYKHSTGFYMAQVIYDKLVQNGYSVFMDKRLERGEFESQIKDALERSRNFIMVLFQGDLDKCDKEDDWLRKEANWAVSTPGINLIPVFCEGFDTKNIKTQLPDSIKEVLKKQSVIMHKDYSLDKDLDELCDKFLENTNPVKPMINTEEFFKNNLHNKEHLQIKSIDMAFHAGAAWLRAGTKKDILDEIIQRKIKLRVLINTPEAAESIAKHMRDEMALYFPFEQVQKVWGNFASKHVEHLEVRVCPIPLIHVYHNIKVEVKKREDDQKNIRENTHDRMHVKYYVYNNTNLDKSFEHELSSFSKYYDIYQKEFEFLWNASTPI